MPEHVEDRQCPNCSSGSIHQYCSEEPVTFMYLGAPVVVDIQRVVHRCRDCDQEWTTDNDEYNQAGLVREIYLLRTRLERQQQETT